MRKQSTQKTRFNDLSVSYSPHAGDHFRIQTNCDGTKLMDLPSWKNIYSLNCCLQRPEIIKHRDLWPLTPWPLTCRLPVLQGGTFSFITPTLAILALPKWQCPAQKTSVLLSMQLQNSSGTLHVEDSDEVWMSRMREVCKIFIGARGHLLVSYFLLVVQQSTTLISIFLFFFCKLPFSIFVFFVFLHFHLIYYPALLLNKAKWFTITGSSPAWLFSLAFHCWVWTLQKWEDSMLKSFLHNWRLYTAGVCFFISTYFLYLWHLDNEIFPILAWCKIEKQLHIFPIWLILFGTVAQLKIWKGGKPSLNVHISGKFLNLAVKCP